ncbi:DUF308 domain-containing protein [Sphingomonas sp. So64.6b]|uniref:DUF308 domain-containing protein n=1 Tax=Sphingomonas sp. So64.6b TaxID=2997354 RepID=UPI0016028021|nr:DUF308 domain-containing protein [Sphingomonas sp. So64.6b]QNA86587.1 DUF308 domain-containing protein [Sphingomonas sp. So64.6b]
MNATPASISKNWLQNYYYTRGLAAAAWVGAAFALGKSDPSIAAMLLLAYPAWDALANLVDARQSGGLKRNPTQSFNVVVSIATTIAVVVALGQSMNAVYAVFGVWAGLAGLLQLFTGVRRWKTSGAQWAMILSGAQSALAGIFFFKQSFGATPPGIAGIAPYAGFGAFYFLVSAVMPTISARRRAATSAEPAGR